MTISTTQAECVAMSDMGKDISFLRQVWCFMLPKVRMPCIVMYEDNEGAIQIANHPISNSNSKHSDCLLYTSPSPRDGLLSRMPSSA